MNHTTGAYFPLYWDDRGYFVGPLRQWVVYGPVHELPATHAPV